MRKVFYFPSNWLIKEEFCMIHKRETASFLVSYSVTYTMERIIREDFCFLHDGVNGTQLAFQLTATGRLDKVFLDIGWQTAQGCDIWQGKEVIWAHSCPRFLSGNTSELCHKWEEPKQNVGIPLSWAVRDWSSWKLQQLNFSGKSTEWRELHRKELLHEAEQRTVWEL